MSPINVLKWCLGWAAFALFVLLFGTGVAMAQEPVVTTRLITLDSVKSYPIDLIPGTELSFNPGTEQIVVSMTAKVEFTVTVGTSIQVASWDTVNKIFKQDPPVTYNGTKGPIDPRGFFMSVDRPAKLEILSTKAGKYEILTRQKVVPTPVPTPNIGVDGIIGQEWPWTVKAGETKDFGQKVSSGDKVFVSLAGGSGLEKIEMWAYSHFSVYDGGKLAGDAVKSKDGRWVFDLSKVAGEPSGSDTYLRGTAKTGEDTQLTVRVTYAKPIQSVTASSVVPANTAGEGGTFAFLTVSRSVPLLPLLMKQ